eukprot:2807429-Rhodomonas_salina.1
MAGHRRLMLMCHDGVKMCQVAQHVVSFIIMQMLPVLFIEVDADVDAEATMTSCVCWFGVGRGAGVRVAEHQGAVLGPREAQAREPGPQSLCCQFRACHDCQYAWTDAPVQCALLTRLQSTHFPLLQYHMSVTESQGALVIKSADISPRSRPARSACGSWSATTRSCWRRLRIWKPRRFLSRSKPCLRAKPTTSRRLAPRSSLPAQ